MTERRAISTRAVLEPRGLDESAASYSRSLWTQLGAFDVQLPGNEPYDRNASSAEVELCRAALLEDHTDPYVRATSAVRWLDSETSHGDPRFGEGVRARVIITARRLDIPPAQLKALVLSAARGHDVPTELEEHYWISKLPQHVRKLTNEER